MVSAGFMIWNRCGTGSEEIGSSLFDDNNTRTVRNFIRAAVVMLGGLFDSACHVLG